jgi:hypothetical protein
MATLYQKVRWNDVYEVLQDNHGNMFIFKNGSYWKSVNVIDEAHWIINNVS